jgi:hypothetical protein
MSGLICSYPVQVLAGLAEWPDLNFAVDGFEHYSGAHRQTSRPHAPLQRELMSAMFTSADCRAQAENSLAQAERDHRHRQRLLIAAEAWLFLASQLEAAEAAKLHEGKCRDD